MTMSRDPPTHAFLHEQIKALLETEQRHTDKLDLQLIADRFGVSITPIREIMFHMMGEGLVEPGSYGGFRVVALDRAVLQQLYAWNGHHLLSAAHLLPDPVMRRVLASFSNLPSDGSFNVVAAFERLANDIAAATGIDEFHRRTKSANDRLRTARQAERLLFGDLERELRSILKVNGFDVRNNVRRRLTAYHRRRVEAAAQISALI